MPGRGSRWSGVIVSGRSALVRAGFAVGARLPLRRRVLLATSHAVRPSANLEAIRAELDRRGIPCHVLAFRPAASVVGLALSAINAVRAGYELARARLVVVDDYFFPLYVIRPRALTTVAQVWHASGAFKRFGYSVLDKGFGADEAAVARVPIHVNYDLALVSSRSVVPYYAEAFRQPSSLFVSRLGIPRTDALFDRPEAQAAAVRSRLGLPSGPGILLYAPTFRGDTVTAARHGDLLDLRRLRDLVGAHWLVLVRAHPFVRDRLPIGPDLSGFAVDVSDEPDVNDLLLAADALVTDYSSVIFEFSLLGRPIAFLASDLESYERERGFYLDLSRDLPGPIVGSTEELADWLDAGAFDTARVEAFARASFDVADGASTRRFVDEVVEPALGGRRVTAGELNRRGSDGR
jgi:CDP-glycerol glycerophosphotransferase (TagB/SpsB family)